MRPILLCSALLLSLAAASPALAQSAEDAGERRIMSSAAFLSGHPDLRYRLSGLEHFRKGDFDEAMLRFRRAARYSDKPSQGMIGEMYWKGTGVAQDKALGYVWMDLAAERAYPLMLAKRERYWNELDAEGRARALEIGPRLYAEFGDDVAKKRLERELRFAKRNTTGSRVGSVGALTIVIPTPGGTEVVDGTAFYDEKFWNIDQYVQWQDTDWKLHGEGTVDVGEIMDADTPLPEDTQGD
ncbi:SEL1-like repeat protein [Arenimonas aestuarii]